MTSERALSAALDLAAGAAAVLSVRDLDAVVWPPLAALVGSDGLAVTGFDGAVLSWPPGGRPSGRHQMAAVLGHGLARARVALVRADRAFTDRDLALLGLVRPHLADALWRAAHEPEPCPLTARQRAVQSLAPERVRRRSSRRSSLFRLQPRPPCGECRLTLPRYYAHVDGSWSCDVATYVPAVFIEWGARASWHPRRGWRT